MNVKAKPLTVQTPIPQKHLSRYKQKAGVYLVRHEETVLYVGSSKNLYKAIMQLFQKNGNMKHLNRNYLRFEIIESNLLFLNIETVLKRFYKPTYNKRVRLEDNPSQYEKRLYRRILKAFLEQTRYEVLGEHQTDTKTQ